MVYRYGRTSLMVLGILVNTLLFTGCREEEAIVTSAKPTEKQVLESLWNNAAKPLFKMCVDKASELEVKVVALCDNPTDASLKSAQEAWKNAYGRWRAAEPFFFGPGSKVNHKIGHWQITDVVFDAAMSSAEYDHLLSSKEMRGFAAVEYLLFSSEDVKTVITPRKASHLKSVVKEIAQLISGVEEAWENGYAEQFISAGNGKPFLVEADALVLVLRECVNVTERILRDRIGFPSNYFKTPAKPELLEAWRSKSTCEGFWQSLDWIGTALFAGGDNSLAILAATKDGLVEKKNPVLIASLKKQLIKMKSLLKSLHTEKNDLAKFLKADALVLQDLYDEFKILQDQLVEVGLVLELDMHQGMKRIFKDADKED